MSIPNVAPGHLRSVKSTSMAKTIEVHQKWRLIRKTTLYKTYMFIYVYIYIYIYIAHDHETIISWSPIFHTLSRLFEISSRYWIRDQDRVLMYEIDELHIFCMWQQIKEVYIYIYITVYLIGPSHVASSLRICFRMFDFINRIRTRV